MSAIPAGFEPLFRTSPFVDNIGPLFSRGKGAGLVVGLHAERKHCNARGLVHGGVLATLADIALGYALAYSSEPPLSLVTASLTLDFAGSAKEGDWMEAHVDPQKAGSRLAFANCYVCVGDQRIVRASAVFAVMTRADK
jgi:acyl-coenzyme A thioesterase 13